MTLRLLFPLFAALGGVTRGCAPSVAPSVAPAALAAAPAGPVVFEDAAAAWGLECRLGHGGRTPLTLLDTAGGGGALLDFDRDGWLDVLIVGERRIWLYRGQRGEALKDVSEAMGVAALPAGNGRWMGCAVGDIDDDGFPDLYVTGYRCGALLRNRRGAGFDLIAGGVANHDHWETGAAFLDADGDGRRDLYVGRYVRFGPETRQLCRFRGVDAACPPHYYQAERGVFYRGLGGGRFREETAAAGLGEGHGKTLGVAVADADGDGRPDLYLANDGVPADHYRGRAGGRFAEQGLDLGTAYTGEGQAHAGMGADWGDLNGDGRLDLAVTAFQHEGTALYRAGPAGFVEAGAESGLRGATLRRLGFGLKLADFDNDGHLDLLQANGHVQDTIAGFDETATFAQPPQLFLGDGRGGLREVSGGAGLLRPAVGRAVATGDLDNDGRIDALLVDAEGAPRLLLNRTPSPGHWLGLRLIGTRGPVDGDGAVVRLRAGGRTQVREARTSGSYLAASDARIHFGLGSERRVEELVVRWPSGTVDRLRDVAADRWLTLVEGSGVAAAGPAAPVPTSGVAHDGRRP